MIKRPLRLALLLTALTAATASAATVFVVKKDAERDARAIGELSRKIAAERQRISELRAEWSALDHPARLQALVDRHETALRLAPITAEQIATPARIASAMKAQREEAAR
ncbi:cell division protein FtsL [Acuticoccus sp.]|uniref:cell division protein FtsL n=1 Tax=Acuticoccus sp. TaxID=1904378 RepID=UPI003B52034F